MIAETKRLTADMVCETGLHIGNREGGNPPRGLNAPILQNPILQISDGFAPYISATSLKGKLRHIAEILNGREWNLMFVDEEIENGSRRQLFRHECNTSQAAKACPVCFLFGASSGGGLAEVTQSQNFVGRLLFRDAHLIKPAKEEIDPNVLEPERKFENTISRLKQRANPRENERAARTLAFAFEVVYFVHEDDSDEKNIRQHLANFVACLRFLEMNYLGGHGSRGYGKLRFVNIKLDQNSYPSLEILQQSFIKKTGKA